MNRSEMCTQRKAHSSCDSRIWSLDGTVGCCRQVPETCLFCLGWTAASSQVRHYVQLLAACRCLTTGAARSQCLASALQRGGNLTSFFCGCSACSNTCTSNARDIAATCSRIETLDQKPLCRAVEPCRELPTTMLCLGLPKPLQAMRSGEPTAARSLDAPLLSVSRKTKSRGFRVSSTGFIVSKSANAQNPRTSPRRLAS